MAPRLESQHSYLTDEDRARLERICSELPVYKKQRLMEVVDKLCRDAYNDGLDD